MSTRTVIATIAAALVICAPSVALGDEPPAGVHLLPRPDTMLTTGFGVIRMPNGFEYFVPQGSHILQPEAYSDLDKEMRRLQEQETRLVTENKSLRETASGWQPGWKIVLSAVIVGVTGGVYLGTKL